MPESGRITIGYDGDNDLFHDQHGRNWLSPGEAKDLNGTINNLRYALMRIRDHGQTHEEPCWALHNGDCADKMQEIARAALDA